MIVAKVIREEGFVSAFRRTRERIDEALHMRRGLPRADILNYCAMLVAPRIGGVAIQLLARLRVERQWRSVALLHPGAGRMSIREALDVTGAKLLHIEGTFGVDTEEILALGVPFIVSVHDFSATPELLAAAVAVVYPSRFLRDAYGVDGMIIEPGTAQTGVSGPHVGQTLLSVAFAGNVKPHKGSQLLPDIARRLDRPLHVFGGGDLRPLRDVPNIVVHGYYRAGTLPSLLARHRIGTVVLPSIVPESYSLVLSEAWLAGAAVIAFDHGAVAERIRRDGGGWLAPLESGAAGLVEVIKPATIPRNIATSAAAAKAYAEVYAATSRAPMIVARNRSSVV